MQPLPLSTYQIPNPNETDARKVAQSLIDQADEDLFCAIGCMRKNIHYPVNEICYLLHQSLEKWLKVAHQMSLAKPPSSKKKNKLHKQDSKDAKRFPHTHDIGGELLPFFCYGIPFLIKHKSTTHKYFPLKMSLRGRQPRYHRRHSMWQPLTQKRKKPNLNSVMLELNVEPILLSQSYPDAVRYRDGLQSKYDLNAQVNILVYSVFLTRTLVKRWLRVRVQARRSNAPTYVRM